MTLPKWNHLHYNNMAKDNSYNNFLNNYDERSKEGEWTLSGDKSEWVIKESSTEVVEDEATRAREWNKEMEKRYERCKRIDAPDIILQNAKEFHDMSYTDYLVNLANSKKERKAEKKAYFDTHKIEKDMVDKMYNWFDKNESKIEKIHLEVRAVFDNLMHPLGDYFNMSNDDYNFGLYDPIVNSLKEELIKKRRIKDPEYLDYRDE